MKVIEICGSPRTNGNTSHILDLCEERIKRLFEEYDYERINLSKYDLLLCRGCRVCFDISETKCPQKDKLLFIREKLKKADCIIVGSPVYVEDISGLMKNFLDRMAFNCHRPFLMGKPAYIYTTSASIASKHAVKTMKNAFISWGSTLITTDNFRMGKNMPKSIVEKTFNEIINKRILTLTNRYLHPTISFYSLITFSLQKYIWGKFKGTVDYDYWNNMNWLKEDCLYYTNVKISFVKKYSALLINTILRKLLKQ